MVFQVLFFPKGEPKSSWFFGFFFSLKVELESNDSTHVVDLFSVFGTLVDKTIFIHAPVNPHIEREKRGHLERLNVLLEKLLGAPVKASYHCPDHFTLHLAYKLFYSPPKLYVNVHLSA